MRGSPSKIGIYQKQAHGKLVGSTQKPFLKTTTLKNPGLRFVDGLIPKHGQVNAGSTAISFDKINFLDTELCAFWPIINQQLSNGPKFACSIFDVDNDLNHSEYLNKNLEATMYNDDFDTLY